MVQEGKQYQVMDLKLFQLKFTLTLTFDLKIDRVHLQVHLFNSYGIAILCPDARDTQILALGM